MRPAFGQVLAAAAATIFAIPLAVAQNADMDESIRSSVSKIVIHASASASGEQVKGSYNKETDGLAGGMAKGAGIGQIPVEVGGVPIAIPIPILREIGMIAGGIRGVTQDEIQEFRDRLTDDLRAATDRPLSNDSLANDVFWGLRNVPSVEPKILDLEAPVPEDTDALLFVALSDFSIKVEGKEAVIETAAAARLERRSDGTTLFRTEARYSDRDTLSNWTDDDAHLWREYRNFARHYIGRELSAALYERVAVRHEIEPRESATVKRDKKYEWRGKTRSLSPTLAWSSELNSADAGVIDATGISWDLEIYESNRPVYSATRIVGESHVPNAPLEACKTYWWSVRPAYRVNGERKIGRWMRSSPGGNATNGNVGRAASEAHAYIQDFATLVVDCKAR
jgi:hypothetical protein